LIFIGIKHEKNQRLKANRYYAKASSEKKDFARKLRRAQSPPETILWEHLRARKLGYKFNRQSILFGYIADFWCPEKMIVIEVDGKYHDDRQEKDKERDERLANCGIKTIRFSASRVFGDIEGVVEDIKKELSTREVIEYKRTNQSNRDKSFAKIRQKHPNAYKSWSNSDEAELIQKFEEGYSIEELSDNLKRQKGAIKKRLVKLGCMNE